MGLSAAPPLRVLDRAPPLSGPAPANPRCLSAARPSNFTPATRPIVVSTVAALTALPDRGAHNGLALSGRRSQSVQAACYTTCPLPPRTPNSIPTPTPPPPRPPQPPT